MSDITGEIVVNEEMKAIGRAFVKEYQRMQFQVRDLESRAEKLEAMVERLIEAGEPRKSTTDKQPPSMWINLVNEWNQRKGEENMNEHGGLEKSLFPRCKEYMNPETQGEIYELKAKLVDANALIEVSAQIIMRSIPYNTLGTMYKPWKEMYEKWKKEMEAEAE